MPIAGSYLTFKGNGGFVFVIASRPETSVKACIFDGIAWYGIPFGFAMAMALGCAALTGTYGFPAYPDLLSAAQNGAGLPSPATLIALLGKGGAGLILLTIYICYQLDECGVDYSFFAANV
jgi:Na+/proline symporter